MFDENEIYGHIVEVVKRETARIAKAELVRYDDMNKLLTLSRIYAILKDDIRNDRKAGLITGTVTAPSPAPA